MDFALTVHWRNADVIGEGQQGVLYATPGNAGGVPVILAAFWGIKPMQANALAIPVGRAIRAAINLHQFVGSGMAPVRRLFDGRPC